MRKGILLFGLLLLFLVVPFVSAKVSSNIVIYHNPPSYAVLSKPQNITLFYPNYPDSSKHQIDVVIYANGSQVLEYQIGGSYDGGSYQPYDYIVLSMENNTAYNVTYSFQLLPKWQYKSDEGSFSFKTNFTTPNTSSGGAGNSGGGENCSNYYLNEDHFTGTFDFNTLTLFLFSVMLVGLAYLSVIYHITLLDLTGLVFSLISLTLFKGVWLFASIFFMLVFIVMAWFHFNKGDLE